jgi:hypothetical protein
MDKIRDKILTIISNNLHNGRVDDCAADQILALFSPRLLVENIIKIGRFTIARVKEIIGKKVLTGIGIARLSDNDTYRKDVAEKIALGRAKKALEMKKNKQPIHNNLMG